MRNVLFLLAVLFVFTQCKQKPTSDDRVSMNERITTRDKSKAAQTPMMTITGNDFLGIKPGDYHSVHSGHLRMGQMQTASGSFPVHYIYNGLNEEMGYTTPDPMAPKLIKEIHLTHPNIQTKEAIKVGTTLGKLMKTYKNVEGFTTNGMTYAKSGMLSFRLDTKNMVKDIDLKKLDKDTKITELVLGV